MLWIDVTDTYLNWIGSPTGIQRTLIGLAIASKQSDNCGLCAWDKENNVWKKIPSDHFCSIFREKSGYEEFKKSTITELHKGSFFIFVFNFIKNTIRELCSGLIDHLWLATPYVITNKLWKRKIVRKQMIGDMGQYAKNSHSLGRELSDIHKRFINSHNKYIVTMLQFAIQIAPTYLANKWWLYTRPLKQKDIKGIAIKNLQKIRCENLSDLPKILSWCSDDAILVADSLWNQAGFFKALNTSNSHPRIIGFCYDIIPVDRPDFVSEPARSIFTNWLLEMLKNSNEVVCISNYTTRRLNDFINDKKLYLPNLKSVRSVAFGNKIENSKHIQRSQESLGRILESHQIATDDFSSVNLKSNNWILWIGSIDVRKNLDVLFLALERLASIGMCSRPVIIAGRPAAGFEYYESKIRNNPVLKQVIVFLNSPSDDLIHDIQMGASLFLFTSWEEGYGLPVAEALQMGIPVIAARSSSVPEVAGDLVEYFEPWDSRGLAELLERFESQEKYRSELTARALLFKPTPWSKTLDDILHGGSDLRIDALPEVV